VPVDDILALVLERIPRLSPERRGVAPQTRARPVNPQTFSIRPPARRRERMRRVREQLKSEKITDRAFRLKALA